MRSRLDDESDFDDEGSASFDFGRALRAVLRRWTWIIGASVFCAVVALVVTSFMPRKYHAAAVVQLEPTRRPLSNIEGFVTDLQGDGASIASEVEIIHSRTIAKRVIDILNLRNDPDFVSPPSVTSNVMAFLGLASNNRDQVGFDNGGGLGNVGESIALADRSEQFDAALDGEFSDQIADMFSSRLSAWRVGKSFLIEISFWAHDPVQAARIANAVAEVYLSEQLNSKRGSTRQASRMLEQKINGFRQKVDAAERKVAQFKIDYGMFSSEGHILSERALSRLMEQTIIARNESATARSQYERAKMLSETGASLDALSGVLNSHTVQLMKDKLSNAMRREAELSTRYGKRHPQMQKVQAELRDARQRLASEVAKAVAQLENTYQQARLREKELLEDLERSKGSEASVTQQSTVLRELERDAKTSRQLLDVLMGRFKLASETEDLQIANARVVETASVPGGPGSPQVGKIVLIACVGGFLLSLVVILGLEFIIPGIGRPEDVETVLELAHLSSLPQIGGEGKNHISGVKAARLVLAEPGGAFAEAIRGMRRELDVQGPGFGSRVVLVAGSLPGEGSSVVASNLAHHYAMTGHSVVLVDGDVRRSKLSNELVPQRQLGLMDVLARSLAIESAILHDRTSNLNFLPAVGSGAAAQPNPELLSTSAMARSVSELKAQFDIVIIDSPPLLPVVDGSVLADYADQILFVMGWRKTPKVMAKRALKCLAVNRSKIAGVVVSDVGHDMMPGDVSMGYPTLSGGLEAHRYAA